MSKPRSGWLFSSRLPKWKESASASLFCSFSFSDLKPRVELDTFNDSGSLYFPSAVHRSSNKLRNGFIKRVSSELAEQSGHTETGMHVPGATAGLMRASALGASLQPVKASLSNVYDTSKGGKTLNHMIRTGRLDRASDAEPPADLPLPSTSGKIDREFWKERKTRRRPYNCEPLGMLYNSRSEEYFHSFWDLPQGKTMEESVRIDDNHSVTTGFEQGKQVDERSIWLSTSHKFGVNHLLATQYANDLKGGNNFNFNSTHNVVLDSTLSTNLFTNSFGECAMEMELQREKKRGSQEVSESVMANLSTGEMLLKLQSKNVKKKVLFMNSVISNLRDHHALKSVTTFPLSRSGFLSSSLFTDMQGAQKLCLSAMQKICNQMMIGATFTSNLKQEESLSVEAKHQLDGLGNLVVKLSNDLQGVTELDISTSLVTKRYSWLWTYRTTPAEGQSLRLEWRHEVSPGHFCSLLATARDWNCMLSAEMCYPF